MQYPDSHTMPFSTVFLGANSRVARRVAGYWPKPPGGGENLLKLARNGTDLTWNMDEAPPSLPQVAGPVVMVCFAGVTPKGGGPLEQNRALALAAHRAARAWGVTHSFYLSSAAVYGDPGPLPVAEITDPTPGGAYGAAKLAMERALLDLRAPDLTILRLANVAGAGEPFDSAARPNPDSLPLHRFANGAGPVRSFVGPRSLARVLARLCARAAGGARLPALLNVAAPRPTAMADILTALGRRWHWQDAPENAIATVHLDTARLATLCPLPSDSGCASALINEVTQDTVQP